MIRCITSRYVVYSATTGSIADMVKYVNPILKSHNVTAYLNGHEHIAFVSTW